MMPIRNLDAYVRNLWDWSILDGCFGNTRISVSDIDGYVERNGHFLILEAKGPGKDIPKGQQISFNAWSMLPSHHVLIVWGEPNKPEALQVWGYRKMPADLDFLRHVVSRWYRMADQKKALNTEKKKAA